MTQRVAADLWSRRFHPAPDAAVRLVCFPHAGGSASFYFPVAEALSPEIEVIAIQYPGRQDRRSEPCLSSLDELADAVLEPLLAWSDRPLALFGHSMGATLAFEVACRLERRAVWPVALFASGRRAPSRHRDEAVHLRDDDQLIAEIRRLSGTDPRVFNDEELLRMVLPSVRADYRAAETYRWDGAGPLRVPVHVLVGRSDPKVRIDEALAWRDHTTGGFTLNTYPGGHFYLNDQATEVLQTIVSTLVPPS